MVECVGIEGATWVGSTFTDITEYPDWYKKPDSEESQNNEEASGDATTSRGDCTKD